MLVGWISPPEIFSAAQDAHRLQTDCAASHIYLSSMVRSYLNLPLHVSAELARKSKATKIFIRERRYLSTQRMLDEAVIFFTLEDLLFFTF